MALRVGDLGASLGAVLALTTGTARAADQARGDDRIGVVVGAGGSVDYGPSGVGVGWDLYAGCYALPWLVTAASLKRARGSSDLDYDHEYDGWLLAARGTVHPLPRFFVDPWVALDAGYASARESSDTGAGPYWDLDTVFIGGGIGIDLAFQTAALGVHVRKRFGFAEEVGADLGLHVEIRF
jgi:hypothetical protein